MNNKGKQVIVDSSDLFQSPCALPTGADFVNASEPSSNNPAINDDGGDDDDDDIIVEKEQTTSKTTECSNPLSFSNDEIKHMIFDNWEAAGAFYLEYSKHLGFGIRKRDSRKSTKGEERMVKWVCSKEGIRSKQCVNRTQRQRRPKVETRSYCPAAFRVNFNRNTKKWYVASFVAEHNHQLAPLKHVKFLVSQKGITEGEKAEVMSIESVGYSNMGWTNKDMNNFIDSERQCNVLGGDVQRMLGYFDAKKQNDSNFFFANTLKPSGQLGNVFWADFASIMDYSCFGDVVAFDTCYKRNTYNYLVVIILGVNHHAQSIVFGCSLLQDDMTNSYVWLLNTFLACMGAKKPATVITDGDEQMRAAVQQVLPNAVHRLCIWHIENNASREITDWGFSRGLMNCMVARVDVETFEDMWMELVAEYKLQNNRWIAKLHSDRQMWAEAHLKEKFCACIRTTARCEGMHSLMDQFFNRRLNLMEFVNLFNEVLEKIRENEEQADRCSSYSTPVCSNMLQSYEKQAANIYTQASFWRFQAELSQESAYTSSGEVVIERGRRTYKLCKLQNRNYTWEVVFNTEDQTLNCSCKLFESWGFPCRHSISVMKLEGLSSIPLSCFHKRWSKEAKSSLLTESFQADFSEHMLAMFRHGLLAKKCSRMCLLASKSGSTFEEISTKIEQLTKKLEEAAIWRGPDIDIGPNARIRDPDVVMSKGLAETSSKAVKSKKECRECREEGHMRNKCPRLNAEVQKEGRASPGSHLQSNETKCDLSQPQAGLQRAQASMDFSNSIQPPRGAHFVNPNSFVLTDGSEQRQSS